MKIIATINEVSVTNWNVNTGEYKAKRCTVKTPIEFEECDAIMVSFTSKENGKFVAWVKKGKVDIPCFTYPGTVSVGVYAYTEIDGKMELRYSPKPVVLPVNLGSYVDGEEPPIPTPGTFEELLKMIDEIITSGVITPDDVLQVLNDRADNEPQKVYSANAINEEVIKPTTMWFNKLVAEKENISNKSTSIDNESTNKQYPSAKAVYDFGLRVIEAHQEQVDAQMNELEERLMSGVEALIGGIENGSY